MKAKEIQFVKHTETDAICRVVTYDEVARSYVIAHVDGGGGIWNDTNLLFAKRAEFTDLTEDEVKTLGMTYLIQLCQ